MVSLERYAIIRASIETCGDRDRMLAKADILPREWLMTERRWHRQLAAEAARGRTDLASRYLAAFNRAVGHGGSAIPASPAAPIMQQLRVAPPPVLPAPSVPRAAAQPRAMPSYLAASAPTAAARPAAHAAAPPSTGEIDNRRLQRAPMPFASASPQTAYLDAPVPARAPTPFVAGAAAAREPHVPPSAPPANSAGTGTALVDEALVDLPAPAMPPELPTLTADQYAWVTASLKRAKSGELDATLTRLRLTPASRVSLDAIWKAHMARYPAVKQAFILALAKHLTPR